jgi:hypothetical protein
MKGLYRSVAHRKGRYLAIASVFLGRRSGSHISRCRHRHLFPTLRQNKPNSAPRAETNTSSSRIRQRPRRRASCMAAVPATAAVFYAPETRETQHRKEDRIITLAKRTAAATAATLTVTAAACGGSAQKAAPAPASSTAVPASQRASTTPRATRGPIDVEGHWTGNCDFSVGGKALQFQDMQLNPDGTAVVGGNSTSWAVLTESPPGQKPYHELGLNLPDPTAPATLLVFTISGNTMDLQYGGRHCTLTADS